MSDPSPLANRIIAIERQLASGGAYDPELGARVARAETELGEVKTVLGRLEPLIVRIDAQIPHLATKAELAALRADLAAKPSHAYLWGVLAALLAAYGSGLAALAILK